MARQAAQQGQMDLALHNYTIAIGQNRPDTDQVINEMVQFSLENAQKQIDAGKFVEGCQLVRRCYVLLKQLEALDTQTVSLSDATCQTVFEQIKNINMFANRQAMIHANRAGDLQGQATGVLNDDERMQMAALHEANLGWMYFSMLTDKALVQKLMKVQTAMKDELSESDYEHVMQRDRVLGIGETLKGTK